MRTIAVCNLKGGVGKTTTTVNLGASLARNGNRVLLIDCDPQCSLTSWLQAEPRGCGGTLYDVLRGQATFGTATVETRWQNVSVIPSAAHLHEIDRGALAGERVLWARMAHDYDYVLLDCSASPGAVLTNALTAAEEVIIPVQAKGMATSGVERLIGMIGDMRRRGGKRIDVMGILVCLFDGRTKLARLVLGELRAKYSDLVFDTVVHESVKLAEAADQRRPITEYDPSSRGAAEYAAVAFELTSREHRLFRAPAVEALPSAIDLPAAIPFRAPAAPVAAAGGSTRAHRFTPSTPAERN